jgi:hypothetical protein
LCGNDFVRVLPNPVCFKGHREFCRHFEDRTVLVPVGYLIAVPSYGRRSKRDSDFG